MSAPDRDASLDLMETADSSSRLLLGMTRQWVFQVARGRGLTKTVSGIPLAPIMRNKGFASLNFKARTDSSSRLLLPSPNAQGERNDMAIGSAKDSNRALMEADSSYRCESKARRSARTGGD